MKNINCCPACESGNFINRGKALGCGEDSVYNDVECSSCSLHWCEPMPTKKDLDDYYNRYYTTRYNTVDKYPWKTKLRSVVTFRNARLKSYFEIIKKYSPDKSILDFGCGEGDILYLAKKENWKTLGIDYSNELSDKFKAGGIEFIHGSDFTNSGLKKNSFGCIFLKHVVEHIPELDNFLESTKEYLVKDGILAIKTPSGTSFRARHNLSDWHRVRPMEHFWGFNINNFRLIMENHGFDIKYMKDEFLVNELTCIAGLKN
ncbi:MAG TPA: class I SAM-dependent methyltransferase [Ignavibacteria bacterium]|nr:hypothetical protein [Bacteroidota bacterium]HRI84111.1 class I SAM-dependent methyltransferase [Ignavibacteria bacterium]HRJ98093.1 class I SAM-dependent methyltransferase [Ignavibacteria bacterium]